MKINSTQQFPKKNQQKEMTQKEHQSMDDKNIKIKSPLQLYPGICNLCFLKQHPTIECPFGVTLYHATNLQSLKSIVQHGFHPKKGRLGVARYCSDEPSMCVRFVLKNLQKFSQPILVKIKAILTNTKTVNSSQQVKGISQKEFKEEKIDCIKCPYFKINQQIQYEFALFDAQYAIVGWSRINLPENKNKETVKRDQPTISLPVLENCCNEKKYQQSKKEQSISQPIKYEDKIIDEKDQKKQPYLVLNVKSSIKENQYKIDEQKQTDNSIRSSQRSQNQNITDQQKQKQLIRFSEKNKSVCEELNENDKSKESIKNQKTKTVRKMTKKNQTKTINPIKITNKV